MKRSFVLVCTLLLFANYKSYGQTEKHFNLANNKIAAESYDVVSYFEGSPQKGKSQYKSVVNGVTYLFSSVQHKKKFDERPSEFQPQYGGWCAYAMGATGEKVEINPKTFKILDGKLYLFYNKFFTNTLDTWNEDESNLKIKADKNWSAIIK